MYDYLRTVCTALQISALSFILCKPFQLTLSKTGTWVKQLSIPIMRVQNKPIARDAWHFASFRVISVFVVRNKFAPSGLYQNKQTSALPNKNKKGYQRNANWDSRERKAETKNHYSWRTHNLSINLHRHVTTWWFERSKIGWHHRGNIITYEVEQLLVGRGACETIYQPDSEVRVRALACY